MRIFLTAIVAILGLSSAQPQNEVTSYGDGFRQIQQNFFNFFDSIGKNDAGQSGTYRDILQKETRKEQQAFDSMKDEFRSARTRNANQRRLQDKNSHTDLEGAVLKRQAVANQAEAHHGIHNHYDFDTEMNPHVNKLLRAVDADKALLDSAPPLPSNVAASVSEKLKVEWAYNMVAAENVITAADNPLTLKETGAIIRGYTIPGKSDRQVREVANHLKAVEFIEALVQKNTVLTEADIREIHSIVVAEIMPDIAGRYREESVPPKHLHMADYVSALLKWYHQARDVHPIKRVAIFYARFHVIQPFYDGNNRTGRLVVDLELMKLGYPPAIMGFPEAMAFYWALKEARYLNTYDDITEEFSFAVHNTIRVYLNALGIPRSKT